MPGGTVSDRIEKLLERGNASLPEHTKRGGYRYALTRALDGASGPRKVLAVIMLNPSLATGSRHDHTMDVLVSYVQRCGSAYTHLLVGNLFACVEPLPSKLWRKRNAIVGEDNDAFVEAIAAASDGVVVAWGGRSHEKKQERVRDVLNLLNDKPLLSLGEANADGSPPHPLCRRKRSGLLRWPPVD